MTSVFEQVQTAGLIPVVVIDDPGAAPALMAALIEGGLPIAEITFRTAAAEDAIRAATAVYPDALIGAGSVLLPAQVDTAVDAGARFIVSPGLEENVVLRARERGVDVLPGCATASDLMRATALGLDVVKFFPAEPSGGLAMIKAIAAPFPGMRFVPSGGMSSSNLEAYLIDPRILAVGGSWMVKPALVKAGSWREISAATRAAVAAVHRTRRGSA